MAGRTHTETGRDQSVDSPCVSWRVGLMRPGSRRRLGGTNIGGQLSNAIARATTSSPTTRNAADITSQEGLDGMSSMRKMARLQNVATAIGMPRTKARSERSPLVIAGNSPSGRAQNRGSRTVPTKARSAQSPASTRLPFSSLPPKPRPYSLADRLPNRGSHARRCDDSSTAGFDTELGQNGLLSIQSAGH